MSKGRVKARWVPDIPTPQAVEEHDKETGMIEIVPEIQSFNFVSPRVEKRVDRSKVLIVVAAVLPITAVNVMAGVLVFFPLLFGSLTVASIVWIAILMMVNIKDKSRS